MTADGGEASVSPDEVPVSPVDSGAQVPVPGVRLPSGQAFLPETAGPLLRERNVAIVILAGPANCGKSTLLTRVYHQLQFAPIEGMSFGGSETLVDLERRCFLSRVESGRATPDTERQKRPEGQTLLHLAIFDELGRHDLLIGDMAGEHFDDIADFAGEVTNQPALGRADTIAVVIDGERAITAERWNIVARAKMMLDGFRASGSVRPANLQIITTKWDLISAAGAGAVALASEAEREIADAVRASGADPSVFRTAARSSNVAVPPGFGVGPLLKSWLIVRPRLATLSAAADRSGPFDRFTG